MRGYIQAMCSEEQLLGNPTSILNSLAHRYSRCFFGFGRIKQRDQNRNPKADSSRQPPSLA
jgi:hypothetical protein